ncbi:MAG: type I methionyl aminopeptidase [Candidatus Babeliaceae bacterium]|nr:type I methionyl aminopeptidase [Candidatus Babeliaceae bacterium]
MIVRKNNYAFSIMREAGKRLASIFQEISKKLKEGITTQELDLFIENKLQASGLYSQCKGYGYPPFPGSACISINDVIVHGIPSSQKLKQGDLVKVDICASYNGYCADMARSYFVGEAPSDKANLLVAVAYKSLDAGIDRVRVGNRISDISFAIQSTVEAQGFGVVRDFAGHGIGKKMHEDPEIVNFGAPDKGPIIEVGMAFALEPMITLGDYVVAMDDDKWTARTVDGSLAAHVEDTVIVTDNGSEIITRL